MMPDTGLQTHILALDKSVAALLQQRVKEKQISSQEYIEIAQSYIALKPSFTSWEEMLLRLKELSQQYPLMDIFYKSTATYFDTQVKPAMEQEKVRRRNATYVLLGKSKDTQMLVPLSQADRLQGLFLVGVNGTGKSTLISNLIVQDIEQGMGLCLLDPHGDLTNDVLARVPENRVEDVILLDLLDSSYPFGLNVFECPDASNLEQVALTASFVMHVFEKVWDVGTQTPQLAQVLRNVTFTLIQNPGTTFAELPLLLQDENVRNKLVANVKNNQVKLFWNTYNKLRTADQLERTSSTLNKADAFLTQPIIANIVGQSKTTIDFRKIMDEGKILLVQLTPQLEDLSRLVGAVFIGQLLMAAMSRKGVAAGERKQFNLYADEYQRFATEDFATLLSEVRKFGVATTIAHQYLDQLDEKNRGASVNAANLVVFRVSGQDAFELAKEFDATPEESLEFRTEPVRVPARDVVWQLLRKGHRDKEVTDFVNMWLAPAQETWDNRENIIKIKQKLSWIEMDEFLKRPDFPDAMNVLNELLFTCMREETYQLNFPPRMIYTLMFINGINEGVKKLVKFKPSGSGTAYVVLKIDEPPSIFNSSPEFDTLCKWDVTREQINQIKAYVCGDNKKKEEQYDLAVNFILHFQAVLRVLSEDLILVDTGQYREVRDKSRPYADVQNEIATKLTSCPNFQARIKTVGGEATVTMLPAAPGLSGEAFADRRMNVLKQTHESLCHPRAEVEQEIEERQEALMQEPEIEPKSRREPAAAPELSPEQKPRSRREKSE